MEAPQFKLKEENIDSWETEPSVMPSSGLDTISSPHHGAESGSLPFSSLPLSVVIKEEPQSPIHVSSEQDTVNFMTLCAHSTTPELPVAPASSGDITHCKMDQCLVLLVLDSCSILTSAPPMHSSLFNVLLTDYCV